MIADDGERKRTFRLVSRRWMHGSDCCGRPHVDTPVYVPVIELEPVLARLNRIGEIKGDLSRRRI